MVLIDQSNIKPTTISTKCQNPEAQVYGLSAFVFEQNFEEKIEFNCNLSQNVLSYDSNHRKSLVAAVVKYVFLRAPDDDNRPKT